MKTFPSVDMKLKRKLQEMTLCQELKLTICRAVLAQQWAALGRIQKQVPVHGETY